MYMVFLLMKVDAFEKPQKPAKENTHRDRDRSRV
jgi:hypothetical protein